jgi:hypothetical protein
MAYGVVHQFKGGTKEQYEDGGFTSPPEETGFEVFNEVRI